MATNTTFIEEEESRFCPSTGEVTKARKRTVKKSKIETTDEYVKVSKYLNVIYAYNNIPLSLVPISLLFAQRMDYKTNTLYLLKDDKQEIAEMLESSLKRVESLISNCKKNDIIRPISRGKYEVNPFLFSTGDLVNTRELQAYFDFFADKYYAVAEQNRLITKQTVRKIVANYKHDKNQIPGQMTMPGFEVEEN